MLTPRESTSAHVVGREACAQEPIHTPGSIQPHGALLVVAEPDLVVLQASGNLYERLGTHAAEPLGRPLEELLFAEAAKALRDALAAHSDDAPFHLQLPSAGGAGRAFHAAVHRVEGGVVIELEPIEAPEPHLELHPLLESFTAQAEAASTVAQLGRRTCEAMRRLVGYDRVLVYRFDEAWDGTVVGEDGNGRFPSLLDHRFPSTDIPAQAREVYRRNRLRIIPDAWYRPAPIVPELNPATGRPLDLTFSILRSVSPVHVEYMRNMGTGASMSVSIMRDGRLWGIVCCHHAEPKTVPLPARLACDLLARAFSLRLAALEQTEDVDRRNEVRAANARLIAAFAGRGDVAAALAEHPQTLLAVGEAGGAAIVMEGECRLMGATPSEPQVRGLADWLFGSHDEDVFSTDFLSAAHPDAEAFKATASGLLAASVSKMERGFVLWFRPEVPTFVKWGGDPTKTAASDGTPEPPRRSFDTWWEEVRSRSLPWRPSEIEGALDLRNAVVGALLKKTEEDRQFALKAGRMGTWELELASGRLSSSETCRANYGRRRDEPFDYHDLAASILDEDRPGWRLAVEEAAAGGRDLDVEHRARWPDGSVHWICMRASCTSDGRGRTTGVSGVSFLVDDRKHAEEALKEADRRKDEFLATLAHELRNPLAPVRTGLEVLKRGPHDAADAAKVRAMMERQLGHMVRLIDDLLDISRVSRGKVELRRERIDLRAVVENAIETSRPAIDGGRHLLVASHPAEPVPLEGDLTRLAQVVGNILTNAAKYTPEGGRIEISARRDGAWAVVSVSDSGVGIAPEMLPTVFEMFSQVNKTLDRSQGGLGIGLALALRLAEMHGGSVEAESRGLGRGSTFTVRLPALPQTEPESAGGLAAAASEKPPKRRVLVVDDNRDGAESLAMLLAISGHDARTAHNGPGGLRAAYDFAPEVVFLDIGLPDMSGYEVAEKLRSTPPRVRPYLIALTGWGSDDDKRRAQAAGFDHHMTKPVDAAAVEVLLAGLPRPCLSRD